MLIVCSVLVVSVKTAMEKTRSCFRWAHTLCAGMEEDFVCEPCQG